MARKEIRTTKKNIRSITRIEASKAPDVVVIGALEESQELFPCQTRAQMSTSFIDAFKMLKSIFFQASCIVLAAARNSCEDVEGFGILRQRGAIRSSMMRKVRRYLS